MSPVSRLMIPILSWLGIAMWTGSGDAHAAIVTQTQIQPFSVSFTEKSLSWFQFNPALGTLLSVEYRVDAELSGSFIVTNLHTIQSIRAHNSENFFDNAFIGPGAPPAFPGSVLTPIPTDPLTDSIGTVIPANSSGTAFQVFTVSPSPQPMSVPLTDLTFASAYFTGVGSITSTVADFPDVEVTGGLFVVDMRGLVASGNATLIYRYDNMNRVVPEPNSAVMFGVGVVAFAVRRFRGKASRRSTSHAI